MFAFARVPPKPDDRQDILFRAFDTPEGIRFQVIRKLDTGDTQEDLKLECGNSYDFKWMANEETNQLEKHTDGDPFTLIFNPDCTVAGTGPKPEMMMTPDMMAQPMQPMQPEMMTKPVQPVLPVQPMPPQQPITRELLQSILARLPTNITMQLTP